MPALLYFEEKSRGFICGPGQYANTEDNYEEVIFMGQASVKVRGIVQSTDFIIPSGLSDGIGIASSTDKMKINQIDKIPAHAWNSSEDQGVNIIISRRNQPD